MHHLILVREGDPGSSGSPGCCCSLSPNDVRWSEAPAEPPEAFVRFGELYQAVRRAFGSQVTITVLDPRNFVSFVPLVVRDAIRFRVPLGAALRALTSTSLATGVLDGRVLFSGTAPSPEDAVSLVAARLR